MSNIESQLRLTRDIVWDSEEAIKNYKASCEQTQKQIDFATRLIDESLAILQSLKAGKYLSNELLQKYKNSQGFFASEIGQK